MVENVYVQKNIKIVILKSMFETEKQQLVLKESPKTVILEHNIFLWNFQIF